MRSSLLPTVLCSAALLLPLAFAAGCAHEVSRTETDKPNWNGGRTQEETVVYKNADGSLSTSHEKQVTNP